MHTDIKKKENGLGVKMDHPLKEKNLTTRHLTTVLSTRLPAVTSPPHMDWFSYFSSTHGLVQLPLPPLPP